MSTTELTLPITGMTCASCVRRVEKALKKVDGVAEVTVNLATEQARVVSATSVSRDALQAAVEKAGYGVGEPTSESVDQPPDGLRLKWMVSLAIGLIMMAVGLLSLDVPAWLLLI